MTPTRQGSYRLFRFFGIDVFVHWSWLLVALYEIQSRAGRYGSLAWNILEYLTLFAVVLLHEFGHALACRQVGGQAEQIVLWPLGGVAYVTPPPRPGPTLWSIAAGPLVNLVLLLASVGALSLGRALGGAGSDPLTFVRDFALINLVLLAFNLLPIYPLDGGQILRALLWFVLGRATSLMVTVVVGLVGVVALFALAIALRSVWLGILAAFALMSCWRGLGRARALARLARLPRRHGLACPTCKTPPPMAELWSCSRCLFVFDTFATGGACPSCGMAFEATNCPDCGQAHPAAEWVVAPATRAATDPA
jgi:Zn-dependent protease